MVEGRGGRIAGQGHKAKGTEWPIFSKDVRSTVESGITHVAIPISIQRVG